MAIAYSLPESISQPESVWIRIYDETGGCVRTLKSISPVIWDGCDEKGAVLGSGIYLCVIGIKENGEFQPIATGRLVNAGI